MLGSVPPTLCTPKRMTKKHTIEHSRFILQIQPGRTVSWRWLTHPFASTKLNLFPPPAFFFFLLQFMHPWHVETEADPCLAEGAVDYQSQDTQPQLLWIDINEVLVIYFSWGSSVCVCSINLSVVWLITFFSFSFQLSEILYSQTKVLWLKCLFSFFFSPKEFFLYLSELLYVRTLWIFGCKHLTVSWCLFYFCYITLY